MVNHYFITILRSFLYSLVFFLHPNPPFPPFLLYYTHVHFSTIFTVILSLLASSVLHHTEIARLQHALVKVAIIGQVRHVAIFFEFGLSSLFGIGDPRLSLLLTCLLLQLFDDRNALLLSDQSFLDLVAVKAGAGDLLRNNYLRVLTRKNCISFLDQVFFHFAARSILSEGSKPEEHAFPEKLEQLLSFVRRGCLDLLRFDPRHKDLAKWLQQLQCRF